MESTPISVLDPIDFDGFVRDDATMWPDPCQVLRQGHFMLIHLASQRNLDPMSQWEDHEGWLYASAVRARLTSDHLEIDAGYAVGIRIPVRLLDRNGNEPDYGPALDRFLAVVWRNRSDDERMETWTEAMFSMRVQHARPLIHDDAERIVNAIGPMVVALATQADPHRPRRAQILRGLRSYEAQCDVSWDEELGETDLETDPRISGIVSGLPEAHGYRFEIKPDWRAAGQRARRGTPRFGWVEVEQRRHNFEPIPPEDPMAMLRAMSEGAALFAAAGIDPDAAIEEVDLSEAENDARQASVHWPGMAVGGGASPLEIACSFRNPHLVGRLVEALDRDALQFPLSYSRRRGAVGHEWLVLEGRGRWAASLEKHEVEWLVNSKLMERDGRTVRATDRLIELIAASRPSNPELSDPGPILPGIRIPGAEISRIGYGHLVQARNGVVFVPLETPREGRAAAARRAGVTSDRVFATGFAIAGGAWIQNSFEGADVPEPWATMIKAGWMMRERTFDAAHLIDTMLRADPEHDVSPWMRTIE